MSSRRQRRLAAKRKAPVVTGTEVVKVKAVKVQPPVVPTKADRLSDDDRDPVRFIETVEFEVGLIVVILTATGAGLAHWVFRLF